MANRTPTALEQFYMMQIMWNGVALQPKRPTLNIIGGTVADDPVNNKIDVSVSGGGGGGASLAANFTQPAVWQTSGAVIVAQVTPNSAGYQAGAVVFVLGGGFYIITAVPDASHLTLGNLGLAGAASPGTTVTSGVLVLLSGPPAPLVEVGGSAVVQRRVLDFEGFTTVDDGANDRTKIVNSAAQVTTTANFTQPAIGSTVTAAVTSSTGYAPGRWATVAGGGRYTVAAVPDGTHLALVNRGGTGNASPGGTVASGAVVSLAATEPLEVLGSALSPFSLRPVLNLMAPEFGAVGDDTTDDTAAWNAFLSEIAATGLPGYVPTPPVAYKVTAELAIPQGATVFGEASSQGQSVVRLHASARSVFMVRTTAGATVYSTPTKLSGLTLDANGFAKRALLRLGDYGTEYRDLFCTGGTEDAITGAQHRQTPSIGTVTPRVGNTSPLITITQRDPLYVQLAAGATTNIRVKVDVGGTTYKVSYDGGATYGTASQAIATTSNLMLIASGQPTFEYDTGLQAGFPSGTYAAGDYWDVAVTVPLEDTGAGSVINADVRFHNVWSYQYGAIYSTFDISTPYSGLSRQLVVVGGTVGVTTNSNVVQGDSGTDFIATGVRPGDFVYVHNTGVPNTKRFGQVAGVLDAHTLITDRTWTFTGSGYSYALGKGWGSNRYDAQEAIRDRVSDGFTHHGPNGVRYAASQGPVEIEHHVEFVPFANWCIGGFVFAQVSGVWVAPHCELGTVVGTNAITCYVGPKVTGGEVIQPPEDYTVANFGTLFIGKNTIRHGIGGAGSKVPFYATAYLVQGPTTLALTDPLPIPDTSDITNLNTTRQIIRVSSTGVMTSATPLAAVDGVRVIWQNDPTYSKTVTFADQAITGTTRLKLEAPYVMLMPGDEIECEQYNGGWWQKGPVRRNWLGAGDFASGDGPGDAFIITTNATSTPIYAFWVGANLFRMANLVDFDLIACSSDGLQVAMWEGVRLRYAGGLASGGGAQIGVTTAEYITGTNSGAPPAGWGYSASSPVAEVVTISVTGALATTIGWKLKFRQTSIPLFT